MLPSSQASSGSRTPSAHDSVGGASMISSGMPPLPPLPPSRLRPPPLLLPSTRSVLLSSSGLPSPAEHATAAATADKIRVVWREIFGLRSMANVVVEGGSSAGRAERGSGEKFLVTLLSGDGSPRTLAGGLDRHHRTVRLRVARCRRRSTRQSCSLHCNGCARPYSRLRRRHIVRRLQ